MISAIWLLFLRNFEDELPLDSFSPLICFNHEDLIAVEFNLTGPATIDISAQYSGIVLRKNTPPYGPYG